MRFVTIRYLRLPCVKHGSVQLNPNSLSSACLSLRPIEEYSSKILEALEKSPNPTSSKNVGSYAIYFPMKRAKIGKYAAKQGQAAALRQLNAIKRVENRVFRES